MEGLGHVDVSALSTEERERYTRQIMLDEIGMEGQQRLTSSSVLVIGAGGLGSPVLMYLAAAGIGRIGVVDHDVVSLSNLQRQILYRTSDIGRPKVEVVAEELHRLNPHILIEPYPLHLTAENADALVDKYDLVVDACDNYTTRLLLDETTYRQGKPYLYGAISGFVGQVALFNTSGAPRYCHLYPDIDESNDSFPIGVLGATAGVIGSVQAAEAVKWLIGSSSTLAGRLLVIDLLKHNWQLYTL